METRVLSKTEELEDAYEILRELRKDLNKEDFNSLYEAANKNNGYEFLGIYVENKCLAIMGYRILHDFVHGKHLYIDDLVVSEGHRSKGFGAKLLDLAEIEAVRRDCQGLRLCTGLENEGAKRFYERNGLVARSYAYKKRL